MEFRHSMGVRWSPPELMGEGKVLQLSTVPGVLMQPRHRFDAKLPSLPTDDADDVGSNSNVWAPEDSSSYVPPIVTTTGTGGSFFPPYTSQSQSQPSSPFSHAPPHQGTVDDFGILPPHSSIDTGGGGGGRFTTFPIKTRDREGGGGGVGYTLCDDPISPSSRSLHNTTAEPPSLNTNTRHEMGVSFSMSVTEALGLGSKDQLWARTTMSDATPMSSAIQPLPPGAAPASVPEGVNPWSLPPLGGAGSGGGVLGLGTPGTLGVQGAQAGKQGRHVSNHSIVSDDDDALLAGGGAAPGTAAPITTQDEGGEMERGQSRHVRFGGGTGHELGEAEEWRRSLEERRSDPHTKAPQIRQGEVDHDQERGLPAEMTMMALPTSPPTSSINTDASSSLIQGKHIPPSSPNPQETQGGGEDERALNAAVVREISRQMDQLTFNPPSTASLDPEGERECERGQSPFLGGGDGNQQQPSREPSPLLPPSAPFAKCAVSPHPFADLNPGGGGGGGGLCR
ncbi:uncharacterized protein LACBIDRAFT_322425 [Laccaria bicolor S238N-H82]|uniref:Predicted protein n=1 Tax=Laccaria bicolor (strain S238N-H82 / ATCC MYA-4686) TaxID=486041 RepID=B0CW87_LACBS|nr:uncharacterized protein LACBIDRAFT_322425 [Laccaria bicolor S238N-H82]EDR13465.1 predicted protein [Laccaria bicolor S238N-H82]|eukprot:XP_001875963.1 predicted protein [Laccaria bicolor S238N-H82]